MKRVIAISLLLAAFVCSLFSEEMYVTDFDVGDFGYSFEFELELTEYGYLGDYVYSFFVQKDVGHWLFPEHSTLGFTPRDQVTLEVASSDMPPIVLKANDTGKQTAYNYLSDGKTLIAFLNALLKDGFIVFDVIYQDNLPLRLYWYIPRSNDGARIEALEHLEIYEKYLYQWSPLE